MAGLTLNCGDYQADLVPAIGGGLAAFRWQGQDVLRSASAEAIASGDPLGLAMFPMVPWSNRIAHGRFRFGGHDVSLSRNLGDQPHAIHGHGWQRSWGVVEATISSAVLVYDHLPDAWPWAYRARLDYRLTATGLETRLSVENRADDPMPAGLGLHPYFERTPQMQLHASLNGWWETDAEILPTVHRAVAPRLDWSDMFRDDRTTDTAFTGWDGSAKLIWPESGLNMQLSASTGARWLVIYAPAGEAIFCLEPVTHPTDALNQSGYPGVQVLQPGETAELTLCLKPGRS